HSGCKSKNLFQIIIAIKKSLNNMALMWELTGLNRRPTTWKAAQKKRPKGYFDIRLPEAFLVENHFGNPMQ
ncbi:MAG TPA: hypothetical protein PK298_17105, partial [Chitinophagaceae bacterium]|nr:hypothetical protein [Chitinophagaceae bacterium]